MNKILIDKFPTWYKDLTPEKNYLVLSNDYDSYYSCTVLKKEFGLEIGGYYSLDEGLYLIPEKVQGKEPIFVDLSVTRCKTFDNHFTFINNLESINPNIITNTYYKKYNGGTLPLLCSLYNRDLSKYNENALTTILCVDGWYIGYYNKGGRYKDINVYWYKMLDMEKYLLPILESHDNQYFINFIKEHNLNAKIRMNNNYLESQSQRMKLPTDEFELVQPVTRQNMSTYQLRSIYEKDPDSIITTAECFKDSYSICRKAV